MKISFKTVALLVAFIATFTLQSCNENEANLDEQKFNVAINMMTEGSNGLVVKNTQADATVVRENTPACVKSLSISATAANGTETKTFNFTPLRVVTDILIKDNTRGNVAGGEEMNMDFWGGSNNVEGVTTSYAESISMDPVGDEQDGISSNATSHPMKSTTNATIYGIDSDIMDAFFAVYPVGTTDKITVTSPISEDVKNVIRSIPPYAVFAGTTNNFQVGEVDANNDNRLDMTMTTLNSRMTITCRFDDGKRVTAAGDAIGTDITGGYSATFTPKFDKGNPVTTTGSTCPARTITDHNNDCAWFVWSNEYAVGGKQVDFNLVIKDANGVVINTLDITDEADLMLANGKDIWVDIIIPEEVIKFNSSSIVILYNWDNEDRQIVVGE